MNKESLLNELFKTTIMNLKSLLIITSITASSIGFSQETGDPVEPVFCAPIITLPHWESQPNRLFVRCPQVDVGIGTNSPTDRLHIETRDNTGLSFVPLSTNQRTKISFLDEGENENWRMTAYNNFGGGYGNIFQLNSAKGGNFWVSNTTMMVGDYFDFDGCIDCSDYRLFVRKGIRTEKLKVDIASGSWADYVFDDSYQLMPLAQVEEYIEENNHLPGIASAQEVENEGMDVGAMNAKLLEKVEELTLYIIEMKKQIDVLEANQNN